MCCFMRVFFDGIMYGGEELELEFGVNLLGMYLCLFFCIGKNSDLDLLFFILVRFCFFFLWDVGYFG